MRPQDRHGKCAVFGHRDHRRLGSLVAEDRRQRPHQDPRRAHPRDGPSRFEEPAQVPGRVGEEVIRIAHASAQPVHLGVAERAGDAARESAAPGGEGEHGNPRAHFHATPRR